MEENLVNNHLIREIYTNRWRILITSSLFLVLSLVLYFVTPKKYTASAIVYPSFSNSIDELVQNPSFGFEIQADRTIQLFESQMMQDEIVEKFDLINYYELDTNSTNWFSQLNKFYARDITFTRTQHQSVMVRVSMEDPFMAAEIANTAVSYLDTIQKSLFMKNLLIVRDEIAKNVNEQQEELDQLLASIVQNDSEVSSTSQISENKLNELKHKQETGSSQSGDAIILEVLENHPGFMVEKQINDYYIRLNVLNSLKVKLADIEKTISLPFPGVYVVSHARPDEKASSPKLFWNLSFGLLIGLVLSIGFVLTMAGFRNLKDSFKEA